MNPQGDSGRPHSTARDGFDVLDACHRQTIFALGKLSALIARLTERGPDDEARALAGEVVQHFSTTARQHHEDEERHLFPRLGPVNAMGGLAPQPGRAQGKAHARPRARGTQRACNAALRPARLRPFG